MNGNKHFVTVGKSKQAFKDIFDMYYKSLCLFAQHYSMDAERSEDIVQDVFIHICEQKMNFASHTTLKVYLYRAVKNKALNVIRRQDVDKRYQEWVKFTPQEDNFFYNRMIKEESYRILFQAIDKLPERPKEVLLLNLQGMKNQEIADHLQISINTMRTHKAKAMKLLKEELKHMYPLVLPILMNLPS